MSDEIRKYMEMVEIAEEIKMATKKEVKQVEPMTPQEIAAMIKEKFVMAATEVANDAHGESVAKEIVSDLNKQKRDVTLRLLGLDNRFGGWEVDHCNGRESPITQYLAAESKEIIQAWVNEAVQEVLTTALKTKIMKDAKTAIKKEIDKQVRENISNYRLGQQAEPIIDALFQAAANEVREELGLNKKE